MGKRGVWITPDTWQKFDSLVAAGNTIKGSAIACGISENSGRNRVKAMREAGHAIRVGAAVKPLPRNWIQMCAEAQRAWHDFAYFRERYMGHPSAPWAVEVGEKVIAALESPHKEYVVINCPPGVGKALALDTPIPTPGGWTTIKGLEVGDEVFDERGKPCRVTYKSEVFYGHDCYEVRADDGASVIADADHQWPVRLSGEGKYKRTGGSGGTRGPKTRGVNGVRTQTTAMLARRRGKRPELAMCEPLDLPEADLPVPPYTLGVWLGDGDTGGARFTAHPDDQQFIRRQIEADGYPTTDQSVPNRFGTRRLAIDLANTGVLGDKHVPETYLRASKDQRLALLQGLIDTDGYVSPTGLVEFTSTKRQLAEAVQHLVRSLGAKASLGEGRATLDGRDCGPKFRVTFYLANAARLPRKAERCRNGVRTPSRYLTVTPVESVPTQCIEVDSASHLFLAGDGLMVTHNTTLMHDLAAWITVRNRAIRGAFISKNSTNGGRMMMRLRRTLERATPTRARDEEKKAGLGADAAACLAADFGLFKPSVNADIWRSDQFVVVQADDTPIDEKEPTWSSYGMRSDVLSNRYDIIIGDDMDDNSTIRTIDASDQWHAKWDDEIENRLEPRGVCFIIMQRFGSNDLSGYNLAKKVPVDEEALDDMTEEEQEAALQSQPSMYQHLKYKAHDETRCKGKETHRFDSPPWPEGCLLDPKRLPWREVNTLRNTKPRSFAIQYQQEDADPESVLIKKAWVYGGTDIDDLTGMKYEAPGCVDRDRGLWDVPDVRGPRFLFATVDPSDRKNWAIHAYLYAPDFFDQLFLLDAVRVKMTANELLDYTATGGHVGLMEKWQQKSALLFGDGTHGGFTHWIVERSLSAQHLAHYQWVQLWERKWGARIVEFQTTGANKWDEQLGVAMVKPWWKSGRLRLPFASGAPAMASLKLIEEVTRYPNAGTDDQVMAHWFAVNKLEEIAVRRVAELPRAPRPSWVGSIPDMRLVGVR